MKKSYITKSGHSVNIRIAECSDAESILAYLEAVSGESYFLGFGPGEFDASLEKEEQDIADFKESEGKLFLVALVESEIVACLTFSNGGRKRTQHSGEFGISIRKEYWGEGLGSLLLDLLLGWGEENPIIEKLNLHVRSDNLRAIRLYLNKGFVFEGCLSDAVRVNGESFDAYLMGRKV